jgi:tetratricopeptide (TPR) repeat protein
MLSQAVAIHDWAVAAIVRVSIICLAVCTVPAFGQVVDAHIDNNLNVNESAYCPHENAIPIDGQVRTSDNSPLPKNVRVILETSEGAFSDQQFPGADGRFRFLTVQGNKYRITVVADGFQRATQNVDDDWGANHSPTIYLVPSGKKSSAPPAEAASDRAAPKQARKEYEAGNRALQAGNPEEARKHLEKAVSEYPCYARAQTALGVTLVMQHQPAAAESAFRSALKCDAGFLEAYQRLAILLKGQNKYAECEAILDEGVRRFPAEWGLHYQLGNAKAGLGDYPDAEQEFLKAQTLNTEPPPEIHLRLAEFYRDWKKYDKARAEAETYLRTDPHGPMAEPAREMLQELQASRVLTTGKTPVDPARP